MRKALILTAASAFALAGCGETTTGGEAGGDDTATEIPASGVEIALADKLDGKINNYCLDIAGGNKDVDPANGLQAHTCYSYQDSLGTDQVFDETQFEGNALSMPIYEVCASASAMEAGAEIGLAECDGSEAQQFTFSGEGTITPVAAENLCFTVADDMRTGRNTDHQIKELTLEECSEDKAASQTWRARKEMD